MSIISRSAREPNRKSLYMGCVQYSRSFQAIIHFFAGSMDLISMGYFQFNALVVLTVGACPVAPVCARVLNPLLELFSIQAIYRLIQSFRELIIWNSWLPCARTVQFLGNYILVIGVIIHYCHVILALRELLYFFLCFPPYPSLLQK